MDPLTELLLKLLVAIFGVAGTVFGWVKQRGAARDRLELEREHTLRLEAEAKVTQERSDETAIIQLGGAREDLATRMTRMEERYESRIKMLEGSLEQARTDASAARSEAAAANTNTIAIANQLIITQERLAETQRALELNQAQCTQLFRENAEQANQITERDDKIEVLTRQAARLELEVQRLTRELAASEARNERRAAEGRVETSRAVNETGKTNPRLTPVKP